MTVEAHIGVADVVSKINDELAKIPRTIEVYASGAVAAAGSSTVPANPQDRAALARALYPELSDMLAHDARLAATR